ncbi:MAG: CvpA family protein [bacterium]
MWLQPWIIDLVIIVAVVFYIVDGVRRGFILVALEVLGFFISLIIAFLAYPWVAKILLSFFEIPRSFANAVSFFVLWLIAGLIYPQFARLVYRKIPARYAFHSINKYLGFLPAMLDALVLLSIVLSLLVSLPLPTSVKNLVFKSTLGRPLVTLATRVDQQAASIFSPAIRDSLAFLTINPKSSESVNLGFSTSEGIVDEEGETELFRLTNEERVNRGLKILTFDPKLREVARRHAEDMLKRGYFSHFTPEGQSPADRVKMALIQYIAVGENLAFAPVVSYAHEGLMNSPGHRANILDVEFGRLGIGVIDSGIYGKMFVEVFAD